MRIFRRFPLRCLRWRSEFLFGFTLNDVSAILIRFGCTFLCFCKGKYQRKAARETFRARKVSRDSSKEGMGFRAFEARKRNPISVYLKPLPTGRQGLLRASLSRGRPSRTLPFLCGGRLQIWVYRTVGIVHGWFAIFTMLVGDGALDVPFHDRLSVINRL